MNRLKVKTEGASVALGLLVGFYRSTNKAIISLSIYNAGQGELQHSGVWLYG